MIAGVNVIPTIQYNPGSAKEVIQIKMMGISY
jgi:hypothetical protein